MPTKKIIWCFFLLHWSSFRKTLPRVLCIFCQYNLYFLIQCAMHRVRMDSEISDSRSNSTSSTGLWRWSTAKKSIVVVNLPLSIDDCPSNQTMTSLVGSQPISHKTSSEEDYFYLYRVSYAWYTFTGMIPSMIFN